MFCFYSVSKGSVSWWSLVSVGAEGTSLWTVCLIAPQLSFTGWGLRTLLSVYTEIQKPGS